MSKFPANYDIAARCVKQSLAKSDGSLEAGAREVARLIRSYHVYQQNPDNQDSTKCAVCGHDLREDVHPPFRGDTTEIDAGAVAIAAFAQSYADVLVGAAYAACASKAVEDCRKYIYDGVSDYGNTDDVARAYARAYADDFCRYLSKKLLEMTPADALTALESERQKARERLAEIVREFLINEQCSCIKTEHHPCPRCVITIQEAEVALAPFRGKGGNDGQPAGE